uniref:Uncharacterized protein n=1 Tax=Rhipicephalus microplus TaxID=6941 RepID=A0A6G5AI19_RHIMP
MHYCCLSYILLSRLQFPFSKLVLCFMIELPPSCMARVTHVEPISTPYTPLLFVIVVYICVLLTHATLFYVYQFSCDYSCINLCVIANKLLSQELEPASFPCSSSSCCCAIFKIIAQISVLLNRKFRVCLDSNIFVLQLNHARIKLVGNAKHFSVAAILWCENAVEYCCFARMQPVRARIL